MPESWSPATLKGLGVIVLGYLPDQILKIKFPSEDTDPMTITGLEIITAIGRDTPMNISSYSVRTVLICIHFF